MRGRVLRHRPCVDHHRAGGEVAFDLLDVEPGEIGEFVVSTRPAPVDLGEPEEVRGNEPNPAIRASTNVSSSSIRNSALVARSRPSVEVRLAAPDAEQNEPVPWVG